MSTAGTVALPVPPEAQLNLADIQGVVLRSYRMAFPSSSCSFRNRRDQNTGIFESSG